jgi:hypothetical protein
MTRSLAEDLPRRRLAPDLAGLASAVVAFVVWTVFSLLPGLARPAGEPF